MTTEQTTANSQPGEVRSSEGLGRTALLSGFAYYVRNANGQEFLFAASFGKSKTKAKRAFKALQDRRGQQARPFLEALGVCKVSVRIESAEWISGTPPANNLFVADGCEPFV